MATTKRKELSQCTRYYCPICGRWVILYVPCLRASCTRCGRRMVNGEPVQKERTA